MEEVEKILKDFLAELVHPEYQDEQIMDGDKQQALDRAREKFEKLILEKYVNPPFSFGTSIIIPTNASFVEPPPTKADELLGDLVTKYSNKPKENNHAT